MTVTTVSVLICTYNRARLLRETLAAVQAQEPPADCAVEIVVVDNNSTDNTQAVVAESAAEGPYRVVALRESAQGKSFALNTGLAHASGQVLALTDDDVLPASNWLRRIVDGFRTRDVSFVFGKVLPRWGRTPPPELLTPQAQDIWGPLAIVDYGDAAADYVPESRSQRLPVGANLAFSRTALTTIGGWRTDLGKVDNTLVSGEDHEIFMRLRRFGLYRGFYDPQASVRHFVPAARLTREYFRRWFYWHGKTQALMLDDLYPELDFSRVPRIAGVPRFAIRQAAQQFWRWARTRGSDAVTAFAQELYLIEYGGLFAQCWRMWRSGRRRTVAAGRTPMDAAARLLILAAVLAAPSLLASPRVQLSIHDGRVWLTADRASVAEILAEWARVGQTDIANGDRVPGDPVTLQLAGTPEAAALEVVLRSAGGYVAVDRNTSATARTMSRYARIVVVPARSAAIGEVGGGSNAPIAPARTAGSVSSAAARSLAVGAVEPTGGAAGAPPPAQPVPEPIEIAPGVRRLIGADGLPVPDDQAETPPLPTSPTSPTPPTPTRPRGRGRP